MAQIREIKKRIKSITSTQKITHARELVAAAKMRKAQVSALAGRPYSISLNEVIDAVKTKSDSISHKLLGKSDVKSQIIILITSDRGLAGGLNINLFREILRQSGDQVIGRSGNINKDPTARKPDSPKTQYITVGKKATTFAAKTKSDIIASFETEEKSPLDLARTLTKLTTDSFLTKEAGKISILYPHFESTVKQVPAWVQILPIEFENHPTIQPSNHPTDLLFEPDIGKILDNILPHYVLTRIYQVLLEAKASEHSARMVAMKNATDAAGDLIEDLTLTYNQARQEAITKELLDIVTAQRAFD